MKFLAVRLFRFRHRGIPGIGRFARRLTRTEFMPSLKSRSNTGLSFYTNPGDTIDQIMLRTGKYEPHILSAIQTHLKSQDVFWDIGCNVGYHSMSIRQLFPDVSIFAFEPNPIIFSRLCANMSLNSQQFKVFNFGLASESGFAELSIKMLGNSGLSSFLPLQGIDYDQKLLCPVFSGDELVLKKVVSPPNVIKVDVENFEIFVLNGMRETLKNVSLRAIIFEARGFREDSELAKLLSSFGFTNFTHLETNFDWLATRPT